MITPEREAQLTPCQKEALKTIRAAQSEWNDARKNWECRYIKYPTYAKAGRKFDAAIDTYKTAMGITESGWGAEYGWKQGMG